MAQKNLVIVESPAKAKTIEKYLGKDYSVKSSFGHIRDLPKKGMSVDIEHGFKPTYQVSADKKKTISELKTAVSKAETVWLASDGDREGEAIAWHLQEALKLKPSGTKRIVFHEITKHAIEQAIENPRSVDMNLVDAQQARRILDRLVGYELSPVLWKKVRPGLSAGRVQSVAVRLIVEREREIKAFLPKVSYKISANFLTNKKAELPAELNDKPADKNAAKSFLEHAASATFTVKNIETKPGLRNPSAPFTTSTLQQEAARRLGFSVRQTMSVAQKLYEHGHITYMRTDSTILSTQALQAAEDYIVKAYGQNYHKQQQYQTKSASAQEAHEAIRPTHFQAMTAGSDSTEKKLYDLIWRRAVASQMAAAKVDRTEIEMEVSGREELFIGKGQILKFDGFFKVYGGSKEDVILPSLNIGEILKLENIVATESFSRPPARYSEASLVRKLEDLGIGRPSTYAPTISTIQARQYVEKRDLDGENREVTTLKLDGNKVVEETNQELTGADKNKLLPTPLAEITTDFLVNHFGSIVDYDFTARAEEDFDAIARGQEDWVKMLGNFYASFHPLIEKGEAVSREETTQTRHLGKDPKTKKPIYARFGRYGPMLQRGETESEEKPDFAPLPEGRTLEDVTLDQALEMFKLPRTVGVLEDGQTITANIGRFGPYIKVGSLFVSIKGYDPMKITEDEARELYAAKQKADAEKHIAEFPGGLKILRGPYGPYITDGKKNARIPKGIEPKSLTAEQCKQMLAAAPAKKRFGRRRSKK